jgi:surface protein
MKLNINNTLAAAAFLSTASAAGKLGSPPSRRTQDDASMSMDVGETAAFADMMTKAGKAGKSAKTFQSFQGLPDLQLAVNAYHAQGCSSDPHCEVGMTYGWPMNSWDVSQVDSFAHLFESQLDFNEDISGWNTSSVTNLYLAFADSPHFNQDLNGWDVSKVTNFYQAFQFNYELDQDFSSWDVSNAEDMSIMFKACYAFRGAGLENWDVSGVKRTFGMFFGAKNFNADVSAWNTSSLEQARGMFQFATAFNQDVSSWDVSKNIDFGNMFLGAESFNQNLCAWANTLPSITMGDVRASVYDFMTHGMFEDSGCPSISPPVKEMGGPFCYSCPAPIDYFESNAQLRAALLDFKEQDCTYKECYVEQRYGPINTWNVSGVNNFARVFSGLNWFNEDISGWDTSNVFAMPETFQYAKKFNQDINGWDVSNVSIFVLAFMDNAAFNQDLNAWDVSGAVGPAAFVGMFHTALTFNGDISSWNVSRGGVPGMFFMAESFNRDISQWNVSSTTFADLMFFKAEAFNQDLSSWDMSGSLNNWGMFWNATSFAQDLCPWAETFNYDFSTEVFLNTNCQFLDDPTKDAGGPFCESTCQNEQV